MDVWQKVWQKANNHTNDKDVLVKGTSASGLKWQFGYLKRPFSNRNSEGNVFLSIETSV
jgi:hypothetical protein